MISRKNKAYGWKPGSTWTTDPLFLKENGQVYFYNNDHLGTPQKLTSVSGAVVWKAVYNAFGEAFVDPVSTVVSNLRFPGQYYDEETNSHYNGRRYYNFYSGRYQSLDPIGLRGGVNLYIYGLNNPIKFIDPIGKEVVPSPGTDFFEPKPTPEAEKAICYIQLGRFKAYCRTKAQQLIDTECKKTFAVRPKQCIEYIQEWYDACIKVAEDEFDDCIKDCDKEK